jgi:hypothetical protein
MANGRDLIVASVKVSTARKTGWGYTNNIEFSFECLHYRLLYNFTRHINSRRHFISTA